MSLAWRRTNGNGVLLIVGILVTAWMRTMVYGTSCVVPTMAFVPCVLSRSSVSPYPFPGRPPRSPCVFCSSNNNNNNNKNDNHKNDRHNDQLAILQSLQRERDATTATDAPRNTVTRADETATPANDRTTGSERDWFIPIFTLVAIAGFLGAYGYETMRLYARGELYLPF